MDRRGVSGKQPWCLAVCELRTLEVGLRPTVLVCFHTFKKPFTIEVAVIRAVDPRHDNLVCRILSGTRYEYPTLAGIIVLFEQQGTADNGRVLFDHAFHVTEHAVGPF